jgi:Domain of unknown function DUF29
MSTASLEQLYEDDFYAWTRAQTRELRRFARSRPNLPLDLAHIAEEIADLGTERRSRIRSWTRRIIEHLLLLEHSPAQDPRRGWIAEIVTFRREIDDHLSATLHRDLKRQFSRLYQQASADLRNKLRLYGETDAAARLPEHCPYTLDQVLGDYWPAAPDERRAPR